jgi:hypothetical protein
MASQNGIDEVIRISNIVKMDVDGLDSFAAIKQNFQLKNPSISIDKVEAFLKEKYGSSEERTATQEIELIRDSESAKVELNTFKKDLIPVEEDASIVANRKLEADKLDNTFAVIAESIANNTKSVPLKIDDFNFTFEVPADFASVLKDAVIVHSKELHASGNLKNDAETAKHLKDFAENAVMFHYGKDIMKKAVEQAIATTTAKMAKKYGAVERAVGQSGNEGGQQAPAARPKFASNV